MCLKKGASIKDKKVLFLCLKDIKMKRWKSTFMHFRSTNCTTQAPVPCLTFQSKGTVKGTDCWQSQGLKSSTTAGPQDTPLLNRSPGSLWALSGRKAGTIAENHMKRVPENSLQLLGEPSRGAGIRHSSNVPSQAHPSVPPEIPKITVPGQPGHSKADCNNFKFSIKDKQKNSSLKSSLL